MKTLKRVMIALLLIIVLMGAGAYAYIYSTSPQYSGEVTLKGLKNEVKIIFDEYAVPHIYAQNQEDAYFALGYIHAQERLFQMEMLRRVGLGRLAEILGGDFIQVDKFFRALGIAESAELSTQKFMTKAEEPYQKATFAYLNGVNSYIENGKTPIEFQILGIEKEKYTPKDVYAIFGYMSFSFATAHRTDPLITYMQENLEEQYLKDLEMTWNKNAEKIPTYIPSQENDSLTTKNQKSTKQSNNQAVAMAIEVEQMMQNLPTPIWHGSNAWVIAPKLSKNGAVLFSNDTHIEFAQPSVWFEAHIEYPDFSFYGNYLAGVPFGVIGHNRFAAWGLTMLENDDIDFYREKINPENKNQVWSVDKWENIESREEIIKVKGGKEVKCIIKKSKHGPMMNEALESLKPFKEPIAMFWVYPQFPSKTLQALYKMGRVEKLEDMKEAAEMIHSPGLNVMYGDKDGNIAWFAVSKIIKRPKHVYSKVILDGTSGKDDPLGYYDFSENPKSINPPEGFIYSANNQPDTTSAGVLFQGYYVPEDRAKRIKKLLSSNQKWDLEALKKMINDNVSEVSPLRTQEMIKELEGEAITQKSALHKKAFETLKNWKGEHEINSTAPVIYYKMIFHILREGMQDELKEEYFMALLNKFFMRKSSYKLLKNKNSIWWDNISTKDKKESRKDIFIIAFEKSIEDLEEQLGSNIEAWQWKKVHTIEYNHPIGQAGGLMQMIFNVGPFGVSGGREVINNLYFNLNVEGEYKVESGPAMRILIDFADIENSLSVLPTGQSGNFMSRHYKDQAELYIKGEFRKQKMNKEDIEKTKASEIVLKPA